MKYLIEIILALCLVGIVSGEEDLGTELKGLIGELKTELTPEQLAHLDTYKSYIRAVSKEPIRQLADNPNPVALKKALAAYVDRQLELEAGKKFPRKKNEENWQVYKQKFFELVYTPCSDVVHKLGYKLIHFYVLPQAANEFDKDTQEWLITANLCKFAVVDRGALGVQSFVFLTMGGVDKSLFGWLTNFSTNKVEHNKIN